jgi:hypothetical protein
VQKNVDTLHRVVTEARARRQRGEMPGADRWRADVQPRAAVRARTVPALERERDLLRARLAEVRRLLRSLNLFFFFRNSRRAPLMVTYADGEGKYGAVPRSTGKRGGAGSSGRQDGRDLWIF